MTKYKNPAIVLGGGINGLGLIRNLGKNGVDVYCVVDKNDPAIYSKFCRKHFIVPHIQEKKEVLHSFLAKLGKTLTNYALLYTTSDLFSLNLSKLKDELKGNYYILLPNAEVVRTLVNKRQFFKALSKHKILHPTTYFPNSIDDVKEISKEIKYPIFVKPSISQIFGRAFHKKGFLANSANELMHYYQLSAKFNIDTIFQEVIYGPATNLYGICGYFDKKSQPKALFAYQRLREWPPMFGTNSLMESIQLPHVTSIRKSTETFLYKLGYHGLMEAEFKRDAKDGVFKLLEINARSWWQNSFPSKCGINIIFTSYLDAINEKIEFTGNYRAGIKWIYFLNDLRSSITSCGSITIKEWINSLTRIKSYAYFSADDLTPWIIHPIFSLLS